MAKDEMDGSKGMSPRKAMGHGSMGMNESFGVTDIANHRHPDGVHPDFLGHTGGNMLEDHERGIGKPIKYHENHHAAQAAPHHGEHHVKGYAMRHDAGSMKEHEKHKAHHMPKPGHPGHAGKHHRKGGRGK